MRRILLRKTLEWTVAMVMTCAVCGCASTISFEDDVRRDLREAQALPYSLSDELSGLVVLNNAQGMPKTFEVGKLLSRLCQGSQGSPLLSLVNSRLVAGGNVKWYAKYTLTVAFSADGGNPTVVTATGSGESDLPFRESKMAGKAAIEDCAVDLYRQLRVLRSESAR